MAGAYGTAYGPGDTAVDAHYALRESIQRVRELEGHGDLPMWNESDEDFDSFMARYQDERRLSHIAAGGFQGHDR